MEDWEDTAASQLERMMGDPLADAVLGSMQILSVTAPQGLRRYQEATLEMLAEAPGMDPTVVNATVVFDRRKWPTVGTRLRARIPPRKPSTFMVDWGPFAR